MTHEEQYRLEMEILSQVIDTPSEERTRIIEKLCAGDTALESRITQLLAAHLHAETIWRNSPSQLMESLDEGEMLAGRFQLVRKLGEGGMGEVWAAFDRHHSDEQVAVKLIRPEYATQPDVIGRFKKEVQLTRAIGHPNVCRVYELFEDKTCDNSRWFLTMELLRGQTLSNHLRSEGAVTGEKAITWIKQMLEGIAAAHRKDVVHRDLKPGNIMLVQEAAEVRAVVTDFGLAKRALQSQDVTQSRAILGTPAYMAPEQIAGKGATAASDLYSFGLTSLAMLRGNAAPEETQDSELNWKQVERLSNNTVARVLQRCLQGNPADRYLNAVEALADWESAAPLSLAQQMEGFRRSLLWIPLGMAIVGLGLWAWNRQRHPAPSAEALSWYRDGMQSLAEGAVIRAQAELDRSAKLSPQFALARAAQAEAFLELDMAAQAKDAMLKAAAAVVDRSNLPVEQAAYLNGIQHLVLAECSPALEELRKMTGSATPEDRTYAALILARAAMRCNQADTANRTLESVAAADARNAAIPMLRAVLAARRRDYPAADALLDRAEELYRVRDQREGLGQVILYRAVFLQEQNQLSRAMQTLDRAKALAETSPNPLLSIRVALERSLTLRLQGNMTEAQRHAAEAIRMAGQHGLDTLSLQALFAAGNIHLKRYELEEGRSQFQRALEIAERFRNEEAIARAQLSLGSVLVRQGKPDEAIQAVQAGLPFYERAGQVRNVANGYLLMGQALLVKGDFVQAEEVFEKELDRARERKDVEREALVLENVATARAELGKLPQALQHYKAVAELHRIAGKKRSLFYGLANVSDMQSRLGWAREAGETLDEARKLANELESQPADLHQRLYIGAAYNALRSGDSRSAISFASRALALRLTPNGFREAQLYGVLCYATASAGALYASHCLSAIRKAQNAGRQSLRDARLLAAQAYFVAGRHKEADYQASIISEELDRTRCPEAGWIAYSIRSAVSRRNGEEAQARQFSLAASRHLETFRLSVSGQNLDRWRRRSDIRALIR
ncbi:MAG: protein kinase [Bryobacteraceae bacterium]